ncbi:MAG: hypothetical protein QOF09_1509 [Alphaproteobacteria bacterium]|jgi:hypothetical protein|nr:hypothetical protein [Alphaproteobacteria bacterium]
MANSENHNGMRLGVSVDTASSTFNIASWTLLAAFTIGGIAAVVIVFAGINKEYHWDMLREQFRTRVVELELEAAKANAELGKANADIAGGKERAEPQSQTAAFDRDAADAQKFAAVANDRAVDAENRTTEASPPERYRNPRTLSLEQVSRITERLKRFESTPFDFSLTSDAEAISLMSWIAKALTDSGWQWKGFPAPIAFKETEASDSGAHRSSGLQIQVDERKIQEWEKPALELRDVLNAAGIEATAEAIKADGVGDNAIHIRVSRAR